MSDLETASHDLDKQFGAGFSKKNPEIVVALLQAYATQRVAYQLRQLGNADASTPMGAIEGLGMHLGTALDGIASALNRIADRDEE